MVKGSYLAGSDDRQSRAWLMVEPLSFCTALPIV